MLYFIFSAGLALVQSSDRDGDVSWAAVCCVPIIARLFPPLSLRLGAVFGCSGVDFGYWLLLVDILVVVAHHCSIEGSTTGD
jgi:hypothetical protein